MTPDQLFSKARYMDVNKLAAARIRARYLLEAVDVYLEDGSDVAIVWAREAAEEALFVLQEGAYEKIIKSSDQSISSEDIAVASKYPVDKLIEFKRGKALAFCHDDHHPTMFHATRKNLAGCPACNKFFSPIDILMFRDGYSFTDAVKELAWR